MPRYPIWRFRTLPVLGNPCEPDLQPISTVQTLLSSAPRSAGSPQMRSSPSCSIQTRHHNGVLIGTEPMIVFAARFGIQFDAWSSSPQPLCDLRPPAPANHRSPTTDGSKWTSTSVGKRQRTSCCRRICSRCRPTES